MEKMLVTQALNELKLLDSRITREINDAAFIVAAKTKETKVVPGVTKTDFINSANAAYQSIKDLIDRRAKIKAAIVDSNSKTEVTINRVTMTVASAIEMKTSIDYQVKLCRTLKAQYENAMATANRKNLDMEKAIDKYLEQMVGADSKNNKDNFADAVQPIREANEYSLVDPLDVKTKADELQKMIEGFRSEVDSVLQVSNCVTWIEF